MTIQTQTQAKYNDELQAVRAIAIGLVLISHLSGLFPWNNGFWKQLGQGFYVGVDLFLCLSGYVITKGLHRHLADAGKDRFWRETAAFWVRRLYRITPSAWLWLLIPLVCYSLANHRVSGNDLSDVISALVHVANIRSYMCAWAGAGPCGGFGHYWSLSLEEQFYLVLPFLFLLFRRRIALALIILVLVQVFLPRPLGHVLGAIKTDALLLGVLIALWSESGSYRVFDPSLGSSRLRFVVPGMLIFCLVGLARYQPVPFFIGMVAVVSSLIIWLCSYDRGYFMKDGFARRGLAWVGDRSFAIYLIHPFAFWAVNFIMRALYPDVQFDGKYTLRFALAALILILACAELNYRFIELPLRRRGASRAKAIAARNDATLPGQAPSKAAAPAGTPRIT